MESEYRVATRKRAVQTRRSPIQIDLSEHAQELIRREVAAGESDSPTDVIERALDFYDQHRPTLESLRAAIQKGLDDVDAGRVTTFDSDEELAEFFADVKSVGRERLAEGLVDE